MHAAALLALLVAAFTAGAARADGLDARDLYQDVQVLAQWLMCRHAADREIIAPAMDIDPKMAVVPPRSGTMRIIRPRDRQP